MVRIFYVDNYNLKIQNTILVDFEVYMKIKEIDVLSNKVFSDEKIAVASNINMLVQNKCGDFSPKSFII